MTEQDRLWQLASAVARQDRMAELLPLFHQRALGAADGRASVLLRLNPRSGYLHADSAAGLDTLDPAPWLLDEHDRRVAERAWTDRRLAFLGPDTQLARRLEVRSVVIAPLQARDRRLGLLVIGTDEDHHAVAHAGEIAVIADLLSIALDRARSHREADLQQALRGLSADLAQAMSSAVDLGATLEIFCDRAARLFAADRVSVWLHDRRARALTLAASSDVAQLTVTKKIATDDASVPVSAVMRQTEPRLLQADEHAVDVVAPLRGRRRALGTLELNKVRVEIGDAVDMLDRVEELARRFSSAIENVWLLDELLRSRRELEITFNSLTDLVIVIDNRLRISQANRAFAARAHRDPAALKDHDLGEYVSTEVISWLEQRQRHGLTRTPGEREIKDDRLGGTFLFTASPLISAGDDPIGTVIVGRDVTMQARLAAEGAELRNRLSQSEKLAALGQFVAGIAHELNNPLQGVLGHLELLLHNPPPPSRLRRDVRVAFREADRAAKIVHNLLVFAGSRRIARRRLNINHVVEKVLGLRGTAIAAASIELVKSLAPKLPRVSGDALLLQQAVLNIVVNAEQAMAPMESGRRLHVQTRLNQHDAVEIAIADSGPGIPAQALPRIFEPFFTTKEVGQGTGLGLAIAYGIVQEHGGRLDARNRAEGGALFTIALPAGSAEAVE